MKNYRLSSRILLSALHGLNYDQGYIIGGAVTIIIFILFYIPLELDTIPKHLTVVLYAVVSIVVLSNGIFNPLVIYLHLIAFSYKNKPLGYTAVR